MQAAQHPTFADFGAATHSHGQPPYNVYLQSLVYNMPFVADIALAVGADSALRVQTSPCPMS